MCLPLSPFFHNKKMNSDIIIIGAGPGGYETALYAAKNGLSVTLFEQRKAGGTCLHEGCIPTKCFCRSAEAADTIAESESLGIRVASYEVDSRRIVERKNEVVAQLTSGIEFLLKHKLITYVPERAQLVDAHTVKSESGDTYTARHILIATGSTAKIPPIAGCDLPGVLTSTELLDIDHIPQRLCIVGAGVIGLEFASIFRSFGSTVTLLEFAKEILPNFDTDISKRLKQTLSKRGLEFFNQAAVTAIEQTEAGLCVHYTWKNQDCSVTADTVLMAVGRSPRVDGLGLDEVGIRYTPKGIETDENLQTNVPDVYAIGDVNGKICVLVDDMIDTAGTICEASKLLIKEGAQKVYVCAAHGILSGPAIQRLEDAPVEEVIITNSIPLNKPASSKFTQLSIAPILGEAISRIHDNESVSSLFGFEKEYKSY